MEIKISPLDIICFHVGGCGDYGPIVAILNSQFRSNAVVVVFEARGESADDLLIQKQYMDQGVRTILIPLCVTDKVGTETFYVNKRSESSSIFKPADKAKGEHVLYNIPGVMTWGDNTELDTVINVETTTIDHIVQSKVAPAAPDVLSIDAQGAEYRILLGGEEVVKNSVTCVVTEVEFFEIYAGQNLFCDQFCFLQNLGFRLVDILNQQFWHPAPASGKGFLTVGEALFLRELEPYLDLNKFVGEEILCKLIKLAAISYCFQRYSYVYRIVEFLLNYFGNGAKKMMENNGSYKVLLHLHRFMSRNIDRYLQDETFFITHQSDFDSIEAVDTSTAIQTRKFWRGAKWWIKKLSPPIVIDIAKSFRK